MLNREISIKGVAEVVKKHLDKPIETPKTKDSQVLHDGWKSFISLDGNIEYVNDGTGQTSTIHPDFLKKAQDEEPKISFWSTTSNNQKKKKEET